MKIKWLRQLCKNAVKNDFDGFFDYDEQKTTVGWLFFFFVNSFVMGDNM